MAKVLLVFVLLLGLGLDQSHAYFGYPEECAQCEPGKTRFCLGAYGGEPICECEFGYHGQYCGEGSWDPCANAELCGPSAMCSFDFYTNEPTCTPCSPGYSSEGHPHECLRLPGCDAITSSPITWPAASIDETVTGTCPPGLTGQPTRTCLSDQAFGPVSGDCTPIITPCPSREFHNAAWPETAPGSMAAGACLSGWEGAPTRRCLPDGTWATSVISPCTAKKCASQEADNAAWPITALGQMSHGTCLPGFNGSPTRLCLENGTLGPLRSSCLSASIKCPPMAYARAAWPETSAGMSAVGTCQAGWEGSPTRKCLDGSWATSVEFHCTRIVCSAGSEGNASFPQMNAGTQAYGTCLSGHGRVWRRCLMDGTLGPVQGTCA